jgi:hypothetical protein
MFGFCQDVGLAYLSPMQIVQLCLVNGTATVCFLFFFLLDTYKNMQVPTTVVHFWHETSSPVATDMELTVCIQFQIKSALGSSDNFPVNRLKSIDGKMVCALDLRVPGVSLIVLCGLPRWR